MITRVADSVLRAPTRERAAHGGGRAPATRPVSRQIDRHAVVRTVLFARAPAGGIIGAVEALAGEDHIIIGRAALLVGRIIAGPQQQRARILRSELKELLVDVAIVPRLAVGLHAELLARQLRGDRVVEVAGVGGIVVFLPAERHLRIGFDVVVGQIRSAHRAVDRRRGLAVGLLVVLDDDLGGRCVDFVVRTPVLHRGERDLDFGAAGGGSVSGAGIGSIGSAVGEVDRLLGEVEDGGGNHVVVLDGDSHVGLGVLRGAGCFGSRIGAVGVGTVGIAAGGTAVSGGSVAAVGCAAVGCAVGGVAIAGVAAVAATSCVAAAAAAIGGDVERGNQRGSAVVDRGYGGVGQRCAGLGFGGFAGFAVDAGVAVAAVAAVVAGVGIGLGAVGVAVLR